MPISRRQLLKTLPPIALSAVASSYALSANEQETMITGYTSNPDLKTLLPPTLWKGTPVTADGSFVNHEFPFINRFSDLLKWQTQTNPFKKEKKADTFRLPIDKQTSFFDNDKDALLWVGHATFLIRLNGLTFLTDPVLGKLPMMKRYSELPFSVDKLKSVNIGLLSHNHRDHADADSVKELKKVNPKLPWLTGLKLDTLITDFAGKADIQVAGWYQQYVGLPNGVEVWYLPSRHWAKRGMLDFNTQLWGAFLIKSSSKTIYFSGDTGYGSHLAEVGKLFGKIDYCIIGTGAYEPRWFMGSNHIAPDDAVTAVNEMGAKNMIPMHYGTFDLSDEPISHPVKMLREIESNGTLKANLVMPAIGEAVYI